jgi:hypothetical protein
MGILDFLKQQFGKNSTTPNSGAATNREATPARATSSQDKGTMAEVEIVGESFYTDAFKKLRKELSRGTGHDALVDVELRNDPGNPHAANGKAVAVFVRNRKVGHVSSFTCASVFEMLLEQGGKKTFPGRIYFGDLRERPVRNSVSIKLSVQVRTPKQTAMTANKLAAEERKRATGNQLKNEFLRNPDWSTHTLSSGDQVVFSGFSQFDLEKLANLILSATETNGFKLLVLHPSIIHDSAKLRDWLARGKPVTNLETFLKSNPEFERHFNYTTGEFDMPVSVTGRKRTVEEPPKATIRFESDDNVGLKLPMQVEILRLPQQTLARYPEFTVHGSMLSRLTDLKENRDYVDELFKEVGAEKTDAILVKGRLVVVELEGVQRVQFQFRGRAIGLVPKNETQSRIRDGSSWKTHSTRGLISVDYKNNLKGSHDSGLNERFF